MNDPIRLLLAGATIGIAGAVAGGLVVAWVLKDGAPAGHTAASQSRPAPLTSAANHPGVRPLSPPANGAPIRPPQFTLPAGPLNTTGARPQPMTPALFQKLQDQPEVKKTREAFLEAQKQYLNAMHAAAGKVEGKPVIGGQGTVTGGQKTASSQPAVQK